MKFVLIVIWNIIGPSHTAPAVAMHEFDTVEACENAGKVFAGMVLVRGGIGSKTDWSCIEKAFAGKK